MLLETALRAPAVITASATSLPPGFRENTLGHNLSEKFKGDDLIRFFKAMLKPGVLRTLPGKPGSNDDMLLQATAMLSQYGTFKWPDFKLTPHDLIKVKTIVGNQVGSGTLTAGRWHKKVHVGFVTLSRMIRGYLDRELAQGTLNWDFVIARCLSMALLSALSARSGDMTRPPHPPV
ncbi:hypothetical protein LTR15_000713 [Elasticomyces elasticus]|nr:hypothetical protein LTR15_000713 [Elasticomyces elasticus]